MAVGQETVSSYKDKPALLGGVYPLLKDLIKARLDIINPVQSNFKDMELSRLKQEFGRDLAFWTEAAIPERFYPGELLNRFGSRSERRYK